MDLTDEQWWSVIRPLIPEPTRRKDGKGRPWRDSREVMNGILWILRTGACWYDICQTDIRHIRHAIVVDFSYGFVLEYLDKYLKH